MNFGRVGFVMEGEWSAVLTYDTLSIVLYEGAVYAAKRQSAGSEPPTHPDDWMLWVGSPVIEAEQTEDGYDLTISNGDGTTSVVHLLNGQVTEAELETSLAGLRDAFNANTAEEYDSTATYSEGDYCLHEGALYRCTEDITTAEAWDDDHWEAAALADDIRDLSEELYDNKADAITSSASGEIVVIEDGADNMPVNDLLLNIEPAQDLHGQDAPYPPGGGRNLKNPDAHELAKPIPANTDFTVTTANGESNTRIKLYNSEWTQITNYGINTVDSTLNRKKRTISVAQDVYYAIFDQVDNPPYQIELGSTATTYAPYSNICPISGWTGVDVYQSNKNLLPTSIPSNMIAGTFGTSSTTIGSASNARVFAVPVPKNTTICVQKLETNSSGCVLALGDTGAIAVGTSIYSPTGFTNVRVANFSTGDHGWLYVNPSDVSTLNALWATIEFMISIGSGRKDYVAPSGYATYPISWETEAGTIYGGVLDVTTGVLSVNTGSIVVDGTLINQVATASTGVQAARIAFTFPTGMGLVACDTYPIVTQVPQSGSIGARQVSSTVYIYNDAFTDLATAQALLNANNVTIIYRLATPTTYQLTPVQIRTLLGQNAFWANINSTVDLDYRADTKLYIEQLTKPGEDDMTANANIAASKFFMVGNRLFLSTAAIAAGETIAPGTNCSEISLADALNSLNS